MPDSSCSRAPAELINHFPKAPQKDELGLRLCSLQNDLAWSLGLHAAMGGGWHPAVVTFLVLSHSTSCKHWWQRQGPALVLFCCQDPRALLAQGTCTFPSLRGLWQLSCHTRHLPPQISGSCGAFRKGWHCLTPEQKKNNWQRCFLGATSSLGSSPNF